MSYVWPLDAKEALLNSAKNPLRPFKCVMLMPFEARFNQVADVIRQTVEGVVNSFADQFGMQQPIITRLDWVVNTGVIHQQIWQEILEADLVFCDITGYNPNVMFECGVVAAWKDLPQVVFLRDHFFRQPSAFDLEPIRYTEYSLVGEGLQSLSNAIAQLTQSALIRYPDSIGSAPSTSLPLTVDFTDNRDDGRLYTPPFAHRRVVNGFLEFGSLHFYGHSWASIGKIPFLNFTLDFEAKFANPLPQGPKIGVSLRSQHFFANFGHHISLAGDGTIWITQPNEIPPMFYEDITLRPPTPVILMLSTPSMLSSANPTIACESTTLNTRYPSRRCRRSSAQVSYDSSQRVAGWPSKPSLLRNGRLPLPNMSLELTPSVRALE
jgi:hypothetical protein